MEIIKASGEKTIFKKNKIEKSVLDAGAPKKFAREVSDRVEKKIHKGAKTNEILDLTIDLLKKQPEVAARYDLKRAIMMLGPNGFTFEEYFSQILKNYGYKTTTNNIIMGKAIPQEVDIIAEKKYRYMIEAKYHNSTGIKTETKIAMYTYARFLDIKSNPKNKFDRAWLVTNTKYTSRAIKYSDGVNLKLTGWKYPKEGNLQELIEDKSLYPITILKRISNPIKEKLFKAKIVIAKDLANHSQRELSLKTNLNERIIDKILEEAKEICNIKN